MSCQSTASTSIYRPNSSVHYCAHWFIRSYCLAHCCNTVLLHSHFIVFYFIAVFVCTLAYVLLYSLIVLLLLLTCFIIERSSCDQIGLSVVLSACVQPRANSYAWIYLFFLSNIGLGQVSIWFHFGGDLNWHLLSFKDHSRSLRPFRHKIDCSAVTV